MIKKNLLQRLFVFIKNNIDKPIVKKIRSLCTYIIRLSFNSNYSPKTNGEDRVLKIITSQYKKPIIFDVRANRGSNTNKALSLGSVVYVIEPVFELFNLLEKLKSYPSLSSNLFIFNKSFSNKIVLLK